MRTRWKYVIVVKKLHRDKCEELKKLVGNFKYMCIVDEHMKKHKMLEMLEGSFIQMMLG
jgi:hypothetical protein